MSPLPRITSVEEAWFAAVPPARAPLVKRLLWRAALLLLRLRPLQRLIEKRYGS